MLKKFLSFLAVFTLSSDTCPFTLITACVCWTPLRLLDTRQLTQFILMYRCSNIWEHLEQWQVNVNVIHNNMFFLNKQESTNIFFVFIKYFYVRYRCGISIVCFTIIVYIIYVFNMSSMNAYLAHHIWDSYVALLKVDWDAVAQLLSYV